MSKEGLRGSLREDVSADKMTGQETAVKDAANATSKVQVASGKATAVAANTDAATANKVTADTALLFPDELVYLEKIKRDLDDALSKAEARVERRDTEYRDMKRYMVEYRGEIDPHEMFQNEVCLRHIDRSGAFSVTVRDKIAKLKDSPYFARIDFSPYASREADAFYIGRFAFRHQNELLVSDWRSPVASMFYDCEVGPAGYTAPRGRIEGELNRKRQFKIKNGVMEYALESSTAIQDDVLQQELSHTSDEKMKSIIATIQKEQNQIIRNEKADTLIIQGAAGSGKTSIALHRIAFLLYRFKETLTAQNVTIVSPNKVFGDYISNVLPELGEEPLFEVSFTDIARVQLEGLAQFVPDKGLEKTNDPAWAERVRYKSTLSFVKQLEEYIQQVPKHVFVPQDYSHGRYTAHASAIQARFNAYGRYPVKRRLHMLADDLADQFEAERLMGGSAPKSRTILKALNKMLVVKSTWELYRAFYKQNDVPDMFTVPAKKTLEWADVYPFLFIHAAYEGLKESSRIKHVVIDEMQDYTPIQYAVLNLLFPCKKTILGDFSQSVNPHHGHTLKDLRQLYSKAEFVELSKSYRSTYEIITFAQKIKNVGLIAAVERHGEQPKLIDCRDEQRELAVIKQSIDAFKRSTYASLGIITKTEEEAIRLYHLLAADSSVQVLTPKSTHFANGVSITSVAMSKGLEFDEVVVFSASSNTYHSEYDRSLLYVACTRAMHRLILTYTGEASPFIKPSALKSA